MEYTPCPMCGADVGELLFEGGDLLHPSHETFKLNTCQQCGHIYQNPRPSVEEISRYYPDNYMPFLKAIEDEPSTIRQLDRRYGRYRRCKAVNQLFERPSRLLDVGCATGVFLDGMRRFGWPVVGVETNASAAAYARERFGLYGFE